jgi:hypothetical protein
MSDSNHDAGLWARLNALKVKSQTTKTTVSELQARFKALKGEDSEQEKESVESVQHKPEDELIESVQVTYNEEEDVGKMLEEMGSTGDFGLEEIENMDSLLDEANKTLEKTNQELPEPVAAERQRNEDTENLADDTRSDGGDSDLAAEYIEKILSDIPVESKTKNEKIATDSDDSPSEDGEKDKAQLEHEVENSNLSILSLPSTPQGTKTEKEPSTRSKIDSDDVLEARLAALTGGTQRQTGATSPDDAEDPTENWCIICYDDATIKCYGCDGDLYCANCWKEGHTGPDAGLEERKHKAAAYKKQAKKSKGRKQIAA